MSKPKNDYVFRCPFCSLRNHVYINHDVEQTIFQDVDDKWIFKHEDIICLFCKKNIELNKKNFIHANLISKIREKSRYKMKLEEPIGGNFITAKGLKEQKKKLGDKIILKIVGEAKIEEVEFRGQMKKRLYTPVEYQGEEKIFSCGSNNQKALMKIFGNDSSDWINEQFEVLLESCSVGDAELQLTVITE